MTTRDEDLTNGEERETNEYRVMRRSRKSQRERRPAASKDYDTSIAAAGGMGGGLQVAKHKQSTGISAGDAMGIYDNPGVASSGEPAAFFIFNGANGPISGVWAPNRCVNHPQLGLEPGQSWVAGVSRLLGIGASHRPRI